QLTLILIGFLIPFFSMATTIEVCPNCEINSISKAIELAKEGDVINVRKGTYQETELTIDKALTLKTEEGAIIDGQNQGEIILITADGVTIDGFEIINVGSSHLEDYSAVRIRRSENFIIQNLTIRNPFFAIYLEKSKNGIVRDNAIYGNAKSEFNSGNGIQLWYSHENLIDRKSVV